MNKYVFPGADASCSLGWVVSQVEAAGFEVKNIDVLGVHYSATLWKWYLNWVSNREKVVEKYGEKSVFFFVVVYVTLTDDHQVVSYLGVLPRLLDHHLQTGLCLCLPTHAPQESQRIPPCQWCSLTCIHPRQGARRAGAGIN